MKERTCLAVLTVQLLTGFSGYGSEHPNFVVILTDDQSWVGSSLQIIPEDGRTRSDYFQTPHIERLAEMGMRFTQGYSPAASCCPTRRSIQTGQTPARHEYHSDRKGWTATYLRQLNIPRMLKSVHAGYQAAHFGKWDHRYDEVTPGEQGYDVSDGYTGNGTGGSKGTGGPAARPDSKRIDTITGRALDFISGQHASGNPFYLQLSHYAVHLDIFYNQSTLDHLRKRSAGRKHGMPEFAAMTADMDASIGRILDRLTELKLLRNTYLIFLSDNGGRNTIPKAPKMKEARNAPLRDGKHSFYEGGIRVPFIVLGPGVKPGSVSTVPVTGLDILPTLADLAGYRKPLPESMDGGSMRSVFHNAGQGVIRRARPFLVFHQAVDRTAISAIRFGDFKLVKNWKKGQLELFDLSKDLSESRDISRRNPEKTRKLHGMLTGFLEEIGAATQQTRGKKKGANLKGR
ncbi:MAG: sulfatase [Roseibacillus sp.]|nr:sulfatase [Roseibacillus sp.]